MMMTLLATWNSNRSRQNSVLRCSVQVTVKLRQGGMFQEKRRKKCCKRISRYFRMKEENLSKNRGIFY
jgi:hypothetical protein